MLTRVEKTMSDSKELHDLAIKGDTKAMTTLKELADKGDAESQFQLASYYYISNKDGGKSSKAPAVRYFILAIQQGHKEEKNCLDRMSL